MFYINDVTLQKFGEYLKDLRISLKLSTQEVSKKTKIDIGTLNRIEQGFIQKINPLMLNEIAKCFSIDVIEFYIILGYLNKNNIIKYCDKELEKNYITHNDFSVPLYDNINLIEEDSNKKMRKINFPFPKKNFHLLKAFINENDNIFVFKHDDEILINEIGIFKINQSYIISEYYEENNYIFLYDLNKKTRHIQKKKDIKIIGKILYEIKDLSTL